MLSLKDGAVDRLHHSPINWLVALGIGIGASLALSQEELEISHSTIDSGGGISEGATLSMHGTLGQAESSDNEMTNGTDLSLTGGFWPAIRASESGSEMLFRDEFESPG